MIYFIRNITNKAIKIGRSNNGGESRLGSLSTGSTSDLVVIFNWDAPDAMEAELHQRYSYCRIPSTNSKKEWFYSDPHLEGFIEGLQLASKIDKKQVGFARSTPNISAKTSQFRVRLKAECHKCHDFFNLDTEVFPGIPAKTVDSIEVISCCGCGCIYHLQCSSYAPPLEQHYTPWMCDDCRDDD